MSIDPRYSLVKEHDKHFEIHDSTDDTKFHVSKKDIHPATQIRILKMQKLSEGGSAGDPSDTGEDGVDEGVKLAVNSSANESQDSSNNQNIPYQAQNLRMSNSLDNIVPNYVEMRNERSGDQPNSNQISSMPSNMPTSDELKSSVNSQIAGVRNEASAEQKQNAAMAESQRKSLEEQQQYMNMQQEKMQNYEQQYHDLSNEVSSGKIDANRLWHEAGTGTKIAATIGMMLGGIGSGLTGGPNLAMQTLQKHIDNDIEAQKLNLSNKRSLLSQNLAAQGNLMSATNMTRLQMMAMAEGRLKQVAAQTGNPIIAARAQQQAAGIQQASMQPRMALANNEIQMAIKKDVIGRLQAQGQQGVQPVDMQDMLRAGLVDKTTAEKEGASIMNRQKAEAYGMDQIQKLQHEQKLLGDYGIPNAINPNALERRKLYTAGVMQAVQQASPSKRLSEEFLQSEVSPYVDKVLLSTDKTEEEKTKGLINLIRQHADPTPVATKYKLPGALRPDQVNMKTFDMRPVK